MSEGTKLSAVYNKCVEMVKEKEPGWLSTFPKNIGFGKFDNLRRENGELNPPCFPQLVFKIIKMFLYRFFAFAAVLCAGQCSMHHIVYFQTPNLNEVNSPILS